MDNWKSLIKKLSTGNDNVVLNPPATEKQLSEIEEKLKVVLPPDIRNFLLELNGDNWLIFSALQIIEINLEIRKLTCYMSLDCLLFIGGNGCGDYFGYPITGDGINDNDLFMWEHEYDNRVWKAVNLQDLINKYYNDEI
jgi:Protein involved in beta-1,3-glucan synthesis